MKILHTADWHLGTFRSPVKDGVNLRTEDTKRCLDELIRVANEEKPDYSLVSGDIFHVGRLWSDRCCEEIITAIHYIRELAAVSKQVVVMRGTPNHDGSGQFNVLSEMFADVPNVHVVITPQVISFDDVDIAVLPGFDRGVFRANHPGLSSDEENVVFDGHVLAWDKIDYDGEFELLIPKNTIDKLKTLGLTGDIRIRRSNAMAVFATKDFEICTRLVQGEYYKYQNMFKELPLHTVISRKELLDAMVRAKMCTAEKCPVKFELSGSQLNLSIKDQTTDYHETVDLQEDISEELTIGFDARLVIETLKAFDCDNVGISLQGPKMPMIVEAEDSDFKTIVLPVAIK